MGILDEIKSGPRDGKVPDQTQTPVTGDPEKGSDVQNPAEENVDDESLSGDVQAGVKAVQAAITVWSKYHLWGAYAMCVPIRRNSIVSSSTDRATASGGYTSS